VRIRRLVPLTVSLAFVVAACGGSSGSSSNPGSQSGVTTQSGPTTTLHVATQASNVPSVSAKMICTTEAQKEIYDSATGVKTVAPIKPTWVGHVYSCDYVYAAGARMRLSVKEMSSTAETTSYYDSLATKLHRTNTTVSVPGAFQVKDGSVVVRKDFKVLLIDVTKLPAQFGVPADTRGNVAINVAATIMGCWTGA
jgi:hypothetical protein